MQYLLYHVIYFRVQGTTMEMFVANVVDATFMGFLCNDMPMMQRLHQHNTRGPMGSHPPLVVTHINLSHSLSHF